MISARPGTIEAVERVINKAGRATVAETAARLIAEVEARGTKLFTTIDHSAEARATGGSGPYVRQLHHAGRTRGPVPAER